MSRSFATKSIAYNQTRNISRNIDYWERHRILTPKSDAAIINAYKMLRTRLLEQATRNHWRAFGVTSVHSGAGKTVSSINLAISLSQEYNHTVMLVDLDLNNPSISNYLDLQPTVGLLDYLEGSASLAEVLVNPGTPGLVVLPGREGVTSSSEILSTPPVVELATDLRDRYPDRIVLFDLPAVTETDDVMLFSPCLDAYLLVVEAGKNTPQQLKQAMALLGNTPCAGTLLNQSNR
ncbi:MAG TPA: exopolysaccharide biosynthesis protein [Gammaproteobacteria bacterium]|nr:exopolysaccharide biosynthesis protein [Gammaproteobacteria bacterium]